MKRLWLPLIVSAFLLSCNDDPGPSSPTASTWSIVDRQGCWLGAYVDDDALTLEGFNAQEGKEHAVFLYYLPIREVSDLNGEAWKTWIRLVLPSNALPLLMILPESNTLSQIAEPSSADSLDLVEFAHACRNLGKARILLSFGHEMNGWWYPWGQQPASYIRAYRTFARIMKQQGGDKVSLCWIPNQGWAYPAFGSPDSVKDQSLMDTEVYSAYFPGVDVVDWVGLTYYPSHYAPEDERDKGIADPWHFQAALDYLSFYKTYAEDMRKPMMIAETSFSASEGSITEEDLEVRKNIWIQRVYDPALLSTRFPRLKLLSWFHTRKQESNGTWHDFRLPRGTEYRTRISDPYFQSIFPN